MNAPGHDVLHAPLGEIIRSVALAIADAQVALDEASTRTAEVMGGRVLLRDPDDGSLIDEAGEPTDVPTVVSSEVVFGSELDADGRRIPRLVSMMELGFVPTFYQFVDTTIEMKLSVRLTGRTDSRTHHSGRSASMSSWSGGVAVHASTVDAGFAASYGYSSELATTVSTKLVPIPPPAALDAQMAQLLAERETEVEPGFEAVDEEPVDPARLDVNSATLDELLELPGVGPAVAQRIVAARDTGPFTSFDDLRERAGLTAAQDALEDLVRF
jgi:DNA uptake protein ComE-like DNA-binding protein